MVGPKFFHRIFESTKQHVVLADDGNITRLLIKELGDEGELIDQQELRIDAGELFKACEVMLTLRRIQQGSQEQATKQQVQR